jgi:peptidoglycan-N-acetylglucosamine deacetylase
VPWTRAASLLLAAASLVALGIPLPGHAGAATMTQAPARHIPEPAAQIPEPAAQMPEPAAQMPEPAAQIPEPAAHVPGAPAKRIPRAPTTSPRPNPAASTPLAPPAARTVALTFDDGPSPWTPKILAVLRRQHVPATFCMLGDEARRYPRYAQMVVRDGHQLCNHSRDHADMSTLSATRARREVVAGEREIRDAAGVAPRLFRFPYGAAGATARTAVAGYGLQALFWDVDPKDWTRPPASTITSRILAGVRPGSVVLMHDGGGDRSHTVASLEATIAALRKRGYRFVLADVVDDE